MKKWFIFAFFITLFFIGVSVIASTKIENTKMIKTNEIYLAGGCFWGTEHFIKQIYGVVSTDVGYANGITDAPTYKEVCTGTTGYVETVYVNYNPEKLKLSKLLELYFLTIDPLSINKQGNDKGTQYRTGIYYTNKEDLPIIIKSIENLEKKLKKPVAIEYSLLKKFVLAESYHQDYLTKKPDGYCHINTKLFELAKKANVPKPVGKYFKQEKDNLEKKLTKIQYEVTQKNATEPPFENEYWDEKRIGIYVDITTGEPLFLSNDKFDSGCGWPSFSKPISKEIINEKLDKSHGMIRMEVRSKIGEAHLGHVFNDGPKDKGGLRYCINSASLRFVPKDKMESEGYGEYISLVK